jgi:ribonuclease BN (tRNA processing enzyme)
MKLVVLGSGTSVPHQRRSSPAYWLETERGSVLLDFGPDTAHRLAQEQLNWPELDSIWISHFHLDHLGGLAPFMFGARWAPQLRDRRKPLRIYGPQRLEPLIGTFNDANNYKLFEQVFPIQLVEVHAGQEFEILPGLTATSFSTPHTSESLAIRLTETRDKSLVYSSDTGFSEQFIDFAKHAAVLVLECSFRRNKPISTHLDLSEAMHIARECEPQTLILTHLYPEWDKHNIVAEAAELWQGRIVEAVDGLRIEL